jgi:hypothetical protein
MKQTQNCKWLTYHRKISGAVQRTTFVEPGISDRKDFVIGGRVIHMSFETAGNRDEDVFVFLIMFLITLRKQFPQHLN